MCNKKFRNSNSKFTRIYFQRLNIQFFFVTEIPAPSTTTTQATHQVTSSLKKNGNYYYFFNPSVSKSIQFFKNDFEH